MILRSNDGEKVSASKRLSVVNPATGKRLAAIPDVDRALLDKAINAARNAFAGWGVVPFEHRQTIVASLLDKIDSHADELCALLTAEQGAPLRKHGRKSLFLPKHSDRPSCKWRHLRKNKMGNP